MLKNKKILLGISGGIASFKAIDIIRLLQQQGAVVKVVLTPNATAFISPLTLQTLTNHPVRSELFDPAQEYSMGHIELSRWADVILIAPASANVMAKLAYGFADNLLTTLCLASTAIKIIAPAMNQVMWQAAVTQENVLRLKQQDMLVFEPEIGMQACGDNGPGRLLEPQKIVQQIINLLSPKLLLNKLKEKKLHIVITAGPTIEAIDPVRYISNNSSGKMGYAMAQAAFDLGATVTLISGPVNLAEIPYVKTFYVKSALQMYEQVQENLSGCDIFIACAAVADYRVEQIQSEKIKKSGDNLQLNLVKNPDIVAMVSDSEPRPFCVGFAAETENLLAHAQEKLKSKKLSMIIANQVGFSAKGDSIGFESEENAVNMVWNSKKGEVKSKNFAKMNKLVLARQLMDEILLHYFNGDSFQAKKN